jgi:ubiquinone/menaquinone biosynthesis C-methylase UbiE
VTAPVPIGNTYDKYGTKNPLARRLMQGFLRDLGAAIPDGLPARVLEVGLGEGEISDQLRERFPTATMVGIDLPDDALARDWRARGLTGVFADAGALPFGDDAFDLVLAIEVLEHLPDPRRALAEIRRVARRDVVLSVPREPLWRSLNLARGAYVKDLGNTPGHLQHWSRRRFAALVESHFDIVSVRSPVPWTIVTARARDARTRA